MQKIESINSKLKYSVTDNSFSDQKFQHLFTAFGDSGRYSIQRDQLQKKNESPQIYIYSDIKRLALAFVMRHDP